MSHKLAGRRVDDVLVEFLGPIEGRNHFPTLGTGTPELSGQLFAADPATTVLVEECTTILIQGTNNSNAIGSTPVRGGKVVFSQDPGDWVTIGTLTVAALLVTGITPTVGTPEAPVAIRLRIDAVPAGPDPLEGSVELVTQWA